MINPQFHTFPIASPLLPPWLPGQNSHLAVAAMAALRRWSRCCDAAEEPQATRSQKSLPGREFEAPIIMGIWSYYTHIYIYIHIQRSWDSPTNGASVLGINPEVVVLAGIIMCRNLESQEQDRISTRTTRKCQLCIPSLYTYIYMVILYIYIYIYIHMYVYKYIYIYNMYIIYICIYVCICICIYHRGTVHMLEPSSPQFRSGEC